MATKGGGGDSSGDSPFNFKRFILKSTRKKQSRQAVSCKQGSVKDTTGRPTSTGESVLDILAKGSRDRAKSEDITEKDGSSLDVESKSDAKLSVNVKEICRSIETLDEYSTLDTSRESVHNVTGISQSIDSALDTVQDTVTGKDVCFKNEKDISNSVRNTLDTADTVSEINDKPSERGDIGLRGSTRGIFSVKKWVPKSLNDLPPVENEFPIESITANNEHSVHPDPCIDLDASRDSPRSRSGSESISMAGYNKTNMDTQSPSPRRSRSGSGYRSMDTSSRPIDITSSPRINRSRPGSGIKSIEITPGSSPPRNERTMFPNLRKLSLKRRKTTKDSANANDSNKTQDNTNHDPSNDPPGNVETTSSSNNTSPGSGRFVNQVQLGITNSSGESSGITSSAGENSSKVSDNQIKESSVNQTYSSTLSDLPRRSHNKDKMAQEACTEWSLVDNYGTKLKLPHTMIFLGKENCDINLKAHSVDDKHAVLKYDHTETKFKLKDLGSSNGTFVNGSRVPNEKYVQLNHMDSLRFGFDPMNYTMEKADNIPPSSKENSETPTKESRSGWKKEGANSSSKHKEECVLAECKGCIAEQDIEHTCNAPEDDQTPPSRSDPSAPVTQEPHNGHPPTSQPPPGSTRPLRKPEPGGLGPGPPPPPQHQHSLPPGALYSEYHHPPADYYKDGHPPPPPPHGGYRYPPPSEAEHSPQYPSERHYGITRSRSAHFEYDIYGKEGYPPPPTSSHPYYDAHYDSYYGHHQYPPPPPMSQYHPHSYRPPMHHPGYYPPPYGYDPMRYPPPPSKGPYHPCPGCYEGTHEHSHHYPPPGSVAHDKAAEPPKSAFTPISTPRAAESEKPVEKPLSPPTNEPPPPPATSATQSTDTPVTSSHSEIVTSSQIVSTSSQVVSSSYTDAINEPVKDCDKPELQPKTRQPPISKTLQSLTSIEAYVVNTELKWSQSAEVRDPDEIPTRENCDITPLNKTDTTAQSDKNVEVSALNQPEREFLTSDKLEAEKDTNDVTPIVSGSTYAKSPLSDIIAAPVRQDQRRNLNGQDGPNLETVKKGTPLYGQPAWWGHDEKNMAQRNGTDDADTERPDSLPFDHPTDGTSKPEGTTPQTPPERDTGPGSPDKTHHDEGDRVEGDSRDASLLNMSGTAFTVDFGDSMGEKAISEFLPPKLRKSIKKRETIVKEKEDGGFSNPTSPQATRKHSQSTKSPRSIRRCGYISDGAKSSDNEDSIYSNDPTPPKSQRRSEGVVPKVTKTTLRTTDRRSATYRRSKTEGSKTETEVTTSKSSSTYTISVVDRLKRDPSLRSRLEDTIDSDPDSSPVRTPRRPDPDEFEVFEKPIVRGKTSESHKTEITLSRAPTKSSGEPVRRSGLLKTQLSKDHLQPREEGAIHDNLSETGTYTIEDDKEKEEIEEARTSIDHVFGVTDNHVKQVIHRPIIDRLDDADVNGNYNGAIARGLEVLRVERQDDIVEVEFGAVTPEPENPVEPQAPADAPKWVNQWAAIKSKYASGTHSEDDGSSSPLSSARRRRKLPSPPKSKDITRTSLEYSLNHSDVEVDSDSPGRQRGTLQFTRGDDEGGFFEVSFDAPTSAPVQSDKEDEHYYKNKSPVTAPVTKTSKDTVISDMFANSESRRKSQSPHHQNGDISTRSIDTNVLLQDTEQVMKHLGRTRGKSVEFSQDEDESYAFKPIDKRELSIPVKDEDSDSDLSSTAATVSSVSGRSRRGGRLGSAGSGTSESRTRPPRVQAARELNNARSRDRSSEKGYMRGTTSSKISSLRQSAENENLGVSDDSETNSAISSISDYSVTASPKMNRKSSKGKGPITMARTNRAFAMRQERNVTKTETPKTPRSRPTSAGHESDRSSSRTSAVSKTSSRSRPSSAKESTRTDISLGQKIVNQSRDNIKSRRSEPPIDRKDGGRHSLRSTRSSSSSTYSTSTVSKSSTSKPDSKSKDSNKPKTLRSKSSTAGLTVSGNNVQSSSRASPSQRSQDYSAWKRRQSYDPRKAAADAKAKTKEDKTTKDKDKAQKIKRAKSTGAAVDTSTWERRSRGDSIASVSSEESSYTQKRSSFRATSKTTHSTEIMGLSKTIADDISQLTRNVESEEELLKAQSFRSLLTSDVSSARSAFSTVSKTKSLSRLQVLADDSSQGQGQQNSLSLSIGRSFASLEPKTVENGIAKPVETYDSIVVSSIYQMSVKVRAKTESISEKLRKERGICRTPSPADDHIDSANPDLAATLSNLKRTHQYLQVMEKALFPTAETSPRDIERKIKEFSNFKPIQVHKPTPVLASSKSSILKKQSSGDSTGCSETFDGLDYY